MNRPEENLKDPLEKVLAGIHEFNLAVSARFANTNEPFSKSHLLTISHVRTELLQLVPRLTELLREVY